MSYTKFTVQILMIIGLLNKENKVGRLHAGNRWTCEQSKVVHVLVCLERSSKNINYNSFLLIWLSVVAIVTEAI